MKKYLAIVVFLLVTSTALISGIQSELDSLLRIVNNNSGDKKVLALAQLSLRYRNVSIDSSLFYSKMALEEAMSDGSNISLGCAYNCFGNYFNKVNQTDSALKYYELAYEYRKQTDDYLSVAYTLSNMAYLCYYEKNDSKALKSAFEALELAQRDEANYMFEGEMLLLISHVFDLIRDYNRSLEYALKAVSLFNKHNYVYGQVEASLFIGQIHNSLKNFSMAKEYLLQAYEVGQALEQNEELMREINNSLGIVYDEIGDYSTSLNYYQKSIALCEASGDSIGLARAYNNLGYVYNRLNECDKAIAVYKKSLKVSGLGVDSEESLNTYNNLASTYLKKGDVASAEKYSSIVVNRLSNLKKIVFIEETFKILGNIALKKNDYKKAYEYLQLQLQYNDSIYNKEKNRSVLEMQIRYETETKEREIELLKKDKEISQLEVERKDMLQRILLLIIIGMLFLVVVTIVVIRIIRKKNRLMAQKNSEFERANEQLMNSEKNLKELNLTKDKLFSIIAHDLKNPFSALMGFSELLENEFDSFTQSERKEYIGVINDSAQNLYKLLDNLLQWSRSQIGTITYTPERFNISNLIWQEVELLQASSEKKKIEINIDVDDSVYVYADENTISSVIRNLLTNAIKFTSQGGVVEVVVACQNELRMAEVVVVDSGVGISTADIEKLFVLDASFTTQGTANEQGTGLGLMLCKEFVENNGGKIWVVSQKGCGSEFHFTLPLAE